jgi:hypothetical protein
MTVSASHLYSLHCGISPASLDVLVWRKVADQSVPFEELRTICDHLVERSASLFLGAGVNAGVLSAEGSACPFASELTSWICRDLLGSPETTILFQIGPFEDHVKGLSIVKELSI